MRLITGFRITRYLHAVLAGCLLGSGQFWFAGGALIIGFSMCLTESIYEVYHD